MSTEMNLILTANGEVFGFPAELGIARIGGETAIAGTLNTRERKLSDFLQNKESGLTTLTDKLTVLPESSTEFTIDFAKKAEQYAFILNSPGLLCGIMLANESKQFVLLLETEKLKHGNDFERFVANVAEWIKISKLNIIAQNKSNTNSLSLLKQLSEDFTVIDIPETYATYQLIASGIFDLTQTKFGQNVKSLTGLNKLQLITGANFNDKSFGARLIGERIETDTFLFENLYFELQKSATEFFCKAAGTFIFKLENMRLGFTLCGAVSNTSFTLSASSLPNTIIPINSRLSFSNFGLSIGVTNSGLSFGMIGRLTTEKLSIFGGFVISPPRISLITAALTSTTGRISLKDIVVEIADIQWEAVNCLDIIAIGDFELENVKLKRGGVTRFPSDANAESYEQDKKNIERTVIEDFNTVIEQTLRISTNSQLTPLGDDSGQYILTDRGTMRHYRIDRDGKVSLNCQIYVCTQAITLGEYDMPVGLFICGTLEIFQIKTRFLFLADKGKTLVALVQIQKINIKDLIIISKSNKALPIEPINGGLAGQLVQPNNEGATLYLNIQKDKGELTFYLNAYIEILKVFKFDSLIIIKEKFVYINIEYSLYGFKVLFNLKGSYESFNTNFDVSIVFDTTDFLEIIQNAQKELKNAANAVRLEIKKAQDKINEAQHNVLKLQNQINDFNRKIQDCKNARSKAKWYQFWIKLAKTAEIAAYEIAKAGIMVAIGVAYAALEVAKAAVKIGGTIVSSVLDSLAYVINAVTQIFWIKSFELGMTATPDLAEIRAKLVLTIFGKETIISGNLELNKLAEKIKEFIGGNVSNQSKQLVTDIQEGKVTKALDSETSFDLSSLKEYLEIKQNRETYKELYALRDSMEDLFIESNNAYFDAFNEEEPNARENACVLTQIRWEEEIFEQQHSDAFDDKFVDSINSIVKNVRQGEESGRIHISDETNQLMDDLTAIVSQIKEENELRKQIRSNRTSLFSRLEKSTEAMRQNSRTRASNAEISAEEANERYANTMATLLKTHLEDKKGKVSDEIRRELGIALYQFRNPEDTFIKHTDNDPTNDEEDL